MTTPTVEQVIRTAKAEVGYHEGRSHGSWNNDQKYSKETPGFAWSNYQAWCDTFVTWCFYKAGGLALLPGPSASCDVSMLAWKRAGRWHDSPQVGDQGFLGTSSDAHHTFLVVEVGATSIRTVEGNTNDNGSPQGDGVYSLVRSRSSILGYGRPAYAPSAPPRVVPTKFVAAGVQASRNILTGVALSQVKRPAVKRIEQTAVSNLRRAAAGPWQRNVNARAAQCIETGVGAASVLRPGVRKALQDAAAWCRSQK